jgi:hypothetical protein
MRPISLSDNRLEKWKCLLRSETSKNEDTWCATLVIAITHKIQPQEFSRGGGTDGVALKPIPTATRTSSTSSGTRTASSGSIRTGRIPTISGTSTIVSCSVFATYFISLLPMQGSFALPLAHTNLQAFFLLPRASLRFPHTAWCLTASFPIQAGERP